VDTKAPIGFYALHLQFRSGRLPVVAGYVGRVRIRAIFDTGGTHTLGNRALLEALSAGRGMVLDQRTTRVIDATQTWQAATAAQVPQIRLGETSIENLSVSFGDFHVFDVWGLKDQPALLIGMDVLGSLAALHIDYRRRELDVLPRVRTVAAR
jgi:hypothetical protein